MNTTNRKATDEVTDKAESATNGAATQATNGAASVAEQARDNLVDVNHSIVKAMDRNRAVAQTLMRAMHDESMRFVNTRMEHTARAIERGRDCQGLSALITLQQEWLLEVARDYAEHNRRLGNVLQEATEHGAEHALDPAQDAAQAAKRETATARAAA